MQSQKESPEVLIEKESFEASLEAAEQFMPLISSEVVSTMVVHYSESPCPIRGSSWSTMYGDQCERRAHLG